MDSALTDMRTRLEASIATRDRRGAIDVALGAVTSGAVTLVQLYEVIRDLQAETGASWQSGRTAVWQEHYTTAVARTIVEACYPLVVAAAAPPNGRTVVLTTPPDEYHDLGLRMLADHFELAGWRVHLLGPSLPVAELVSAAEALAADAVVLSASTHYHRLGARRYVDALGEAAPGLRVWVGGPAFARSAEGWSPDELIEPDDIGGLAAGLG